jgi:hypothetical protein
MIAVMAAKVIRKLATTTPSAAVWSGGQTARLVEANIARRHGWPAPEIAPESEDEYV